MATTLRLFVDTALEEGASVTLAPGQVHYVRNVMRRNEGDSLSLFNGRDGEWSARIEKLGKKEATARVEKRMRAPSPEPDLWLCFSPIKRDAVDLMVQKATELGAARLTPVLTERTNSARINLDRLQSIAIEAAEQSGRLTAPEVASPRKLLAMLDDWPSDRRLLYCDEAGDDPDAEWGGARGRAAPALSALSGAGTGPWAILIGPEGGFTSRERGAIRARAFVTPVTLGPRILRADTAAIAAITLWQAALGDLRET